MKANLVSSLCALALGLTAFVVAPDAMAQAKAKPKPKTEAQEPAAPVVTKPIAIQPKDLAWGIDRKKLATIYDKVIDEDYKPKYLKAQPGVQMEALDAEVAEKKAEFRRSLVEFGSLPTGIDGSNLRAEYTYKNKEAMMSIGRGGKTRYFFFIQDRLYKIVDELKLGEASTWGKNFQEAAAKIAKFYGVAGRVRTADQAKGRPFDEVDWKDTTTEVRASDWANGKFALIFQDAATVANLGNLRSAKPDQANPVDPTVAGVVRPPDAPKGPVEDPKKKTPPPKNPKAPK